MNLEQVSSVSVDGWNRKLKGGRQQLVITEIPYTMIGANIGKFLNDIATPW